MKALGTHSLVQMKEGAAPGLVAVNTLQRNVAEQIRHGLAVVRPADGLGEDHGNVDDLQTSVKHKENLHDTIPKAFEKSTHQEQDCLCYRVRRLIFFRLYVFG